VGISKPQSPNHSVGGNANLRCLLDNYILGGILVDTDKILVVEPVQLITFRGENVIVSPMKQILIL